MRKDSRAVAAVLLSVVLLITALLTAACREEPENTLPPVASGTVVVTPDSLIPTNDDPSIRGYITRITYAAEYTEILVEYFPEDETAPVYAYSKVLVKLDDKSAVAVGNDPAARTSLSVGSEVEVWFSDPTAESYPVIAYGQAVRVVTAATSMTELRSLPYLSVTGSSTCITVVTKATWSNRELEQVYLGEALEKISGVHMTAAPGDIITLKFSQPPKSVDATMSTASFTYGKPIDIVDGKITVPENAEGQIYIRVNAEWNTGNAQYAFSITVQENSDN